MTPYPYLDPTDQRWRIRGYEEYSYDTEDDAKTASHMARQYSAEQQVIEFRYRRAAERGKVAHG